MNVKNEAHEYALKAMEAELTKIEEAYIAGYEAGKKVGFKPIEIDENGIEWVDMSLPSGTLWSKPLVKDSYFLNVAYVEAMHYNLPTEEDVKELKEFTKRNNQYDYSLYHSKLGVEYKLRGNHWLKGEPNDEFDAPSFDHDLSINNSPTHYNLGIVLVKHTDKK